MSESDVQKNEEANASAIDHCVIEDKSIESDVCSPNGQNNITETPNANKDFTEESPKKIDLSPIISKLEQDEKNTGDGEKEEGKYDIEEGTIDVEKEEDEVNSDEPDTNSAGKNENTEQSPVNVVRDVLVGGASADLVDNEEER